jgi:hypothetical protein
MLVSQSCYMVAKFFTSPSPTFSFSFYLDRLGCLACACLELINSEIMNLIDSLWDSLDV